MASPVIDIYILYIYTRKIVPVVRLSWLAPARLANDVCDAVPTDAWHIYVLGGAYGGFFLWRELIVKEHSKL